MELQAIASVAITRRVPEVVDVHRGCRAASWATTGAATKPTLRSETPVLVYVLLKHQSTPDRWLRLRLLGYCVQVWLRWQRRHDDQEQLPLLVPPVFYQGAWRWEFAREFADLVTDAAPQWRWVPRFEHLLIDQTERGADSVTGAVAARLLRIAMMAAFRETRGSCWNGRRG